MTARPPLGVQQRQPQSRLSGSGSGLSQRPAAHPRTLSQHPLPPSPMRRETTFHDFNKPPDANDVAQGRYAAQRRGGSRLRQELSHEDSGESATAHEGIGESLNTMEPPLSSKPFTPSRMMPPPDPSELGDLASHSPVHADNAAPLPIPAPPRQAPYALAIAQPPTARRATQPSATPSSIKKDSRPRPWTVETPAIAPRYPLQLKNGSGDGPPAVGFADFFPWSGDHAEDRFSETVIRQGYFDRAPVAHTETSSARGAVVALLKHQTQRSALSTVFASVLGQRRHSAQITAASTFKPPPRVTLTDTKRELWLKDLANPAISLRRLSRTIPHGIRGRILLDQCVNKKVPTDRAVWLAKCVGANEIRAFKRKGVNGTLVMGGEAKWIRDWTVFVEQFVESILFGFEDPEWKPKVHYAVRLATHLYAEHLLDRDHYMEWLVSSLENTQQFRLPMWVLITQVYWKDLMRQRRYGRRLVTALLSHLQVIAKHAQRDIFAQLSSRLRAIINTLLLRSPENFVSPSAWSKHRDTLKSCLPAGDQAHENAFMAVSHRNEQLLAVANRSQPAARHILVRMLDSTFQTPMADDLPAKCWGIAGDKPALTRALLEWCTSLYRPGLAKIYVTSRILRHWATLRVDTTLAILDLLDSDPLEELGRKTAVYHLVCELVRSGHFSVSHYMQWLIARGGLTHAADVAPDGPGTTRLLAELPCHALSPPQREIRAGLLRRASFSVEDEARDAELALKLLRQSLSLSHPLDAHDPQLPRKPWSITKLCTRIANSSRSLKAEVGSWLQRSVAADTGEGDLPGNQGLEMLSARFNKIRTLLEATEDFSMLADVMKSLTITSDAELLAAIADTVNRHLFIFAALGISKNLFSTLHRRLKAVAREQGAGARPLLASLACLAPRMPGLDEVAAQLKKDLALADRHSPIDACSPVSDSMLSSLQDHDTDLHEEIEKLLAGGTSLDKNTMERLFKTVVERLQTYWDKEYDKQRAYSGLLARLRVFDVQHFGQLITRWLGALRTLASRPPVLRIFPLLVCVGCLSLSEILATTIEASGGKPAMTGATSMARPPAPGQAAPFQLVQTTYRTRFMQEVLELFMTPVQPDGLLSPEESYRFSTLQDQAKIQHSRELLVLIRFACAEFSYAKGQYETENLPLDKPTTQDLLLAFLRLLLVLRDPPSVARALAASRGSQDPHVGSWVDYMTTKLLSPTGNGQTRVTFDQVLELTNEFTLPFCQVKLMLSLAWGDQNSSEATDRQQSHLELFARAMDNAIDARNISWTGMLSCLSPEITHHLKSRAQARFLGLLPLPSARHAQPPAFADRPPPPLEQKLQMAENLLAVMETIIRGGSMGRHPQLVPAMVDKFCDLWEILASADCDAKPPVLNHWLPFLLNFIILHTQTFDTSKPSNEVRAKALMVCAGLMLELETLSGPGIEPPTARSLSDRIFDFACLLVDNLAEDSRQLCVRALRDSTSAARLRYIFSISANPSENMMFCNRDKSGATPALGVGLGVGLGLGPGSAPTIYNSSNNQRANPMYPGTLLGTPPSLWGLHDGKGPERLSVFHVRRWEILSEPTPNVSENDTALSLTLFEARKMK
ncbi:mediator of RNA polymerase II transcription subunit 12 [Diplogelasinospora grovesii]|uniref:Mediator of RNA polymerase II transcription subunit 12 n=1 Tax=Diplogelasinospora grovesii TaxID=303347 RepID=A0AAN6N5A2_9PEZI|nr:mediator of RNA polymerase II transcription subunit 12 [Diplogelasinospora grovesii]